MSRQREEETCPNKIIDDFGFCYALGMGLGTVINGARGLIAGPKNKKMVTMVEMLKRRVPAMACGFGLWGGAFGFAQCVLLYVMPSDSIANQAISGGFAGGLLNIRGRLPLIQVVITLSKEEQPVVLSFWASWVLEKCT